MNTIHLYIKSIGMLLKSHLQYPSSFIMQTLAQLVMEGGEMMLVPGDGEEGMEGEGEFPGEGPGERPGNMPGDEDGMGQGSGEGEGEGIPSNMTEPVYDPISGAVPYGKVFSAYYSDYLRDAENGEIPYEAEDAARAYFEDLDR